MIKAERYGGELLSDLVGNHSTVARQNGWPGGVQNRCGVKLAHRPRPLPTVRPMILPKEETKTQRLLNNGGQTSEFRGRQEGGKFRNADFELRI